MPVGFAVEKPGERRVVDAVAVAFDIADERPVGISPSGDGVEVAGWPREHRRCGVGGLGIAMAFVGIGVGTGVPGCATDGDGPILLMVGDEDCATLGCIPAAGTAPVSYTHLT